MDSVPEHGPSRPGASSNPIKKTRVALACKRCKRRKQRCDGRHPVCSSCERVGVPCLYERPVRPQYPGGKTLYINALEERIAFLEARLPAFAEDHFQSKTDKTRHADDDHADSASSHRGSISEDVDHEESHQLVDGVAYLSLRATGTSDTSPDPFYLGSSSGATIARMIQTSIFRNSRPRDTTTHLHASPMPDTPGAPLPTNTPSDFPCHAQASLLFDTFFDRLHTRWPLLDRKLYTSLFARQYENGALSMMQRSTLHLIYAVAARFLQLTRNPCGVDPERHMLAAIEPMDHILEQHNLGTVQVLLLLALHGQRSPYGAGAWSQIRYAVSLCIELGLHRKRAGRDARDLELRRRVFWCFYSLDRGTSLLLGRAFSIADRDINVEMPSMSTEFWDLTHDGLPESSGEPPWSNIAPFIHITKLDRIQSRIHRTVFRVDKDVVSGEPEERDKLDRKMEGIKVALDRWMDEVPRAPRSGKRITWMYDPESANHDSQDFFRLQYHKGVLALFTVLLPVLDPSDHRFITCARSAASVCIAYKRLNQQGTLSYTTISLHSAFVAGLTLVYTVWRNRGLLGGHVFEAIQSCSQSLTIFGEKWTGAVKYRDIFDALSGSLFKSIMNPSSLPEVISPGMSHETPCPPEKGSGKKRASVHSGHVPQAPLTEETMSGMVSDAVKEAFMEVDEEAPGGWQGWRMWSEMLGESPSSMDRAGVDDQYANDGYPGDSVDDTPGHNDWELGGF